MDGAGDKRWKELPSVGVGLFGLPTTQTEEAAGRAHRDGDESYVATTAPRNSSTANWRQTE